VGKVGELALSDIEYFEGLGSVTSPDVEYFTGLLCFLLQQLAVNLKCFLSVYAREV
jgi:hypothetical protein